MTTPYSRANTFITADDNQGTSSRASSLSLNEQANQPSPSPSSSVQANQSVPVCNEGQSLSLGMQDDQASASIQESQTRMQANQSTSPPVTISSDSDDATSGHHNAFKSVQASEEQELAKLAEIFPTMTPEQLKFVYSLPKQNKFDRAVNCFMEGPSLESLRALLAIQLVVPLSESP